MAEDREYVLVITSCANRNDADKLSLALLEKKLAACASVVSGVRAHYWWKGKIESDNEAVILIKTEASKLESLEVQIKDEHSYRNPEIIVLPIKGGSESYLNWISEVLAEDK